MRDGSERRRTWGTPLHRLASALLVTGALAACDSLLDVEAPTRIPEETLADPQSAELLVTSAAADFDCAFAEYVVAGGLLGDELADSQLATFADYDRRTVSRATPQHAWTCELPDPGIYQTLSTARYSADNAARLLASFDDADVPNRDGLLATVEAYAGYTRLLLGEAYCSAGALVPGPGGTPEPGPEVTSRELLALAEERFTRAIRHAEENRASDILPLALLGRARARLNQGNGAGAKADAERIPADFAFHALYSPQSFRSSNRVWTMNNRDRRITIQPEFWDLEVDGTPDPRVPVVDEGTLAADDFSPYWTQSKYPARDSPIPVARYEEAQLIVAEVDRGQTAVDIINRLHARAGLPDWTPADPNDEVEVLGHIIEERRREFFLESHHFGDKLRYRELAQQLGLAPADLNAALPPSPPPGEPYLQQGGTYGELECLPLPDVERNNNPHIP